MNISPTKRLKKVTPNEKWSDVELNSKHLDVMPMVTCLMKNDPEPKPMDMVNAQKGTGCLVLKQRVSKCTELSLSLRMCTVHPISLFLRDVISPTLFWMMMGEFQIMNKRITSDFFMGLPIKTTTLKMKPPLVL
ncbi:hypothetical protein JTB14_001568 [Gonioctena quinquepunctata]|nr:hypothetical protein JTB14_001568 [Gonioctena quinquepunctata]